MGTKCKWSSPGIGELSIAFPAHELLATVKHLQCGRLNLGQTQYGRQRCASTMSPLQICLSFSRFSGLCVGWTVVDGTNYLTINSLVREEGFNLVLERGHSTVLESIDSGYMQRQTLMMLGVCAEATHFMEDRKQTGRGQEQNTCKDSALVT